MILVLSTFTNQKNINYLKDLIKDIFWYLLKPENKRSKNHTKCEKNVQNYEKIKCGKVFCKKMYNGREMSK